MQVKHLIAKLKKFDSDMDVFALIEGDSEEYPIHDVQEGELEDADSVDDVVFIMA